MSYRNIRSLVSATILLAIVLAALPAVAQPGRSSHFSLDFVQTDIVDVVKALSLQSGQNVAVSGATKGQVTLRLTNVTLEEALNLVTRLNKLEWARVESAYVVGNPEEIQAMAGVRTSIRSIRLARLSPKEAQDALAKPLPSISCSILPASNSLVMSGTAADLDTAATILAQLEEENAAAVAARASAEHYVYQVKYADAVELKGALTSLLPDLEIAIAPRSYTPMIATGGSTGGGGLGVSGGGGISGGTGQMAGPQISAQTGETGEAYQVPTGLGTVTPLGRQAQKLPAPLTTLILTGSAERIEQAKALLAKLDVAPRLVKVSVRFLEVINSKIAELGIEWSGLGGPKQNQPGSPLIVGERGADPTSTPQTPIRDEIWKIGQLLRNPISISARISALLSRGYAKVLAEPTLTTLDGLQASLHAGDTIWFPRVAAVSLGTQVITLEQVDVGVVLLVTPRVSDNGDITMTLAPSVSNIIGTAFGNPKVTTRSTITTIRIKSGQTVVIAGLMREDVAVDRTKVPLLGDIPIIGKALFQSTSKSRSKTEVVIFITPEIVENI